MLMLAAEGIALSCCKEMERGSGVSNQKVELAPLVFSPLQEVLSPSVTRTNSFII